MEDKGEVEDNEVSMLLLPPILLPYQKGTITLPTLASQLASR